MNVQPITINSNLHKTNNKNSAKNKTFKGYNDILQNAFKTEFKTERQAEDLFRLLFKSVCEEKNIHKNPTFNPIKYLYENKGFRGLLNELWRTDRQEDIAKMLKDKEYNYVMLILKYGQPIFSLFNFGKHGLFDSPATPNNVKVIFNTQNQKDIVEFSMNKPGNVILGKSNGKQSLDTEFYSTTGNRKKEIFSGIDIPPVKTFYNEDGSEPFFKNLFFGGTVPVIW